MERIYTDKIEINKIDNKTHKKIRFCTDKSYHKLVFEFQYSPKLVDKIEDIEEAFNSNELSSLKNSFISSEEKINNLLTLSLYCDDEYIGCAHRHNYVQIIEISESKSTEGFKKTKLGASAWELVISVHAAYSDNIHAVINIYAV